MAASSPPTRTRASRTIVVTCTNGEFGDAPGGIKPGQHGHDPEAVARLRLAELEESASILKISDVETLGYHDSGMPDWEYKNRPDAFSNVPLEDVAGRIGEPDHQVPPAGPRHLRRPGRLPAPGPCARQPGRTGRGRGDRHPGEGLPVHDARSSNWRKIWEALREAGEEVPTWDGRRRAHAAGALAVRGADHHDGRHPPGPRAQARGAVRARQPDQRLLVQQDPAGGRRSRPSATSTSSGSPTRRARRCPKDDLFAGLRTGA